MVGFFPHLPLPLRLIDPVCGFLIPPEPGTTRTTIRLPNATAQYVCAPGCGLRKTRAGWCCICMEAPS
ncbi:hypothetical protein NIIDMKKI_05520 [Mycobacterium kansasii]|nr:hypothetical protein NIIDMKKI_05520 [Mycobacterium kansasii]